MPPTQRARTLLLTCSATLLLLPALAAQPEGVWDRPAEYPPGFDVINTKHYQIQSECGPEKGERLALHMEKMLYVYKRMFKGSASQFQRRAVKLLEDLDSYHAYGGPRGSAGYYHRGTRELVLYDTSEWSDVEEVSAPTTGEGAEEEAKRMRRRLIKDEMDTLGVAAHEGWHQFFHWYVVSFVSLPSWINEGMGDYFYAGKPVRKGRKVDLDFSDINRDRFPIVYTAIKQGRHVPLPEFLLMYQQDYYANPGVCYAQGWALCYFLNECDNRRYNRVIPDYIRYVRDDSNFESVTEKAFRGIDLEELEKEFHEYVMTTMKERFEAGFDGKGLDGEGGEGEGEGSEDGDADDQTAKAGR
jgi:hypothetical protein